MKEAVVFMLMLSTDGDWGEHNIIQIPFKTEASCQFAAKHFELYAHDNWGRQKWKGQCFGTKIKRDQ